MVPIPLVLISFSEPKGAAMETSSQVDEARARGHWMSMAMNGFRSPHYSSLGEIDLKKRNCEKQTKNFLPIPDRVVAGIDWPMTSWWRPYAPVCFD